MVAAVLAVARALLAIARAVRDTRHVCCTEQGIVVVDGRRVQFHRHEWTAEQWSVSFLPATERRGVSATTARSKPRKPRLRR